MASRPPLYEHHDDSGNWYRAYGNENWEFDDQGLMYARHASINELPNTAAVATFIGHRVGVQTNIQDLAHWAFRIRHLQKPDLPRDRVQCPTAASNSRSEHCQMQGDRAVQAHIRLFHRSRQSRTYDKPRPCTTT